MSRRVTLWKCYHFINPPAYTQHPNLYPHRSTREGGGGVRGWDVTKLGIHLGCHLVARTGSTISTVVTVCTAGTVGTIGTVGTAGTVDTVGTIRIVHNQFTSYLQLNDTLTKAQSGNKKWHSTEKSVIETTDTILRAIDQKMFTSAVLFTWARPEWMGESLLQILLILFLNILPSHWLFLQQELDFPPKLYLIHYWHWLKNWSIFHSKF